MDECTGSKKTQRNYFYRMAVYVRNKDNGKTILAPRRKKTLKASSMDQTNARKSA